MGRQEMHFSEVDFDDLVRRIIVESGVEQGERQIDWVVPTLPKVHGDAAMLRQVWMNLIGNGIKYTRHQGRARIEIGWREESERELVFFVKDNGVGFDNKYAGRLFGVFQRLHSDEEFEGTGIGLANVRRIVHRHSGRTWADGEVGNGAIFYFSLLKHYDFQISKNASGT
jgi:light-regulated signal transduction histidine kinase (bacteriophytochrome)